MKKSVIGIIAITSLLFINCENQTETKEVKDEASVKVQSKEKEFVTTNEIEASNEKEALVDKELIESLNSDELCYVGQFEALDFDYESGGMRSNKISIQFDSIINDTLITGHSVVAGNLRPFSGSVFVGEHAWSIDVKEPGNDKYDGQFRMELKENKLSGKWHANDSKLKVPVREFNLESKTFNYDPNLTVDTEWIPLYEHGKTKPDIYIDEETGEEERYEDLVETLTEASMINASIKELKKQDLENLYKTDMEIIRNAIYARHGYSFKNRKIRHIFDSYVEWYIPFSIDVSEELTDLEIKNIELIKRYEKHAETYYDSFGR